MKRYIKYSKNYRMAIVFFIVGLVGLAWVMAVATFFAFSESAVLSAFFVPSFAAISLFLAIKYWFKADFAMYGWYGYEEPDKLI